MNRHDITFLKHFSQIILGLVLLTIVLIVFAVIIHNRLTLDDDTTREALIDARIQPLAAVYAGETGAAAMAAAAEADAAAAATQAAYGGSLDGGMIYESLCGACHTSGAGGAPTLDRANWSGRLAQGRDTLVKHAIEGYQGAAGLMPARGGNPALNDEQVAASVDWMIDNLK